MKTILVTGGAGYIGSHTCLCLLENGFDVVVVDNLNNSHPEALKRVQELAGCSLSFIEADVCDRAAMQRVFSDHPIDAAIHFAGYKAVGESVAMPLAYFSNNLVSTLVLCEVMAEHGVRNLVFSSSATVYGNAESLPIPETAPLQVTNPYGRTKLMIEQMLQDLYAADPTWNLSMLRYFNPVGAHPSGRIGEDPTGIPNNLFPYITQVAVGRLRELSVFGDDYPTPDGTCLRDYIHVMDLAEGHVHALRYLATNPGYVVHNLGTGRGNSVLEAVHTFEKVCGVPVPHRIAPRRAGDAAACYADASRAERELGWTAKRNLEDMVRDSWAWQQQNPQGYRA